MLTLNFTPFPVLTTQRLILRKPLLADDKEIFELRADKEHNRYVDRPLAQTIEDAQQFLQKLTSAIDRNESIAWAISLKDSNKLLGSVCLWNIAREDGIAEIGFELHPQHQGKGIMTEAVEKTLEYGFEQMRLQAVAGWVHPGNERSIRLLERLGFKRDFAEETRHAGKDYFDNTAIFSLRPFA